MHSTAYNNCQEFFTAYEPDIRKINPNYVVLEIGSQDVNGSLRPIWATSPQYIGLDFESGKGVDIVINDPYKFPIPSDTIDLVVSSSCFEHSELFWLLYIEILRVLKPHGLFYVNAPSNGYFHRFPVDCWRFYPDSGNALVKWAKYNNINAQLLESYISYQHDSTWNDFVAVFVKNEIHANLYPRRILDTKQDIFNGIKDNNGFINYQINPEDRLINYHLFNKLNKTT